MLATSGGGVFKPYRGNRGRTHDLLCVMRAQNTNEKGKAVMGKMLNPLHRSCYLTNVKSPQQQKANALTATILLFRRHTVL